MARHWEDREKIKAGLGSQGKWGHIFWFAAALFAVLGVIGDAMNITLVLQPISWFLLAIFLGLSATVSWITWMLAVHLDAIEAKRKKED